MGPTQGPVTLPFPRDLLRRLSHGHTQPSSAPCDVVTSDCHLAGGGAGRQSSTEAGSAWFSPMAPAYCLFRHLTGKQTLGGLQAHQKALLPAPPAHLLWLRATSRTRVCTWKESRAQSQRLQAPALLPHGALTLGKSHTAGSAWGFLICAPTVLKAPSAPVLSSSGLLRQWPGMANLFCSSLAAGRQVVVVGKAERELAREAAARQGQSIQSQVPSLRDGVWPAEG